jgi:S1-C subfamily serine protease
VTVVHKIELRKKVAQLREQQNRRIGVAPSAPDFVYNIATGIVVDESGHVLTRLVNLIPGDKDQKVSISGSDGSTLPASLIGVDFATGFAVLEAPALKGSAPKQLHTEPIASGSSVRILSTNLAPKPVDSERGAKVYLAPSLRESQGQVLAGVLHSRAQQKMTLLSESFRSGSDSSVITDFDNKLVGMAQYAGIGRAYVFPFAYLRDTVVKRVVASNADVPAGWLGIVGDAVMRLPGTELGGLGLQNNHGVLVREIVKDSPAAAAGLLLNDVIIGVDEVDVVSTTDLAMLLASYAAGSEITVRAVRTREPAHFKVKLGAKPLTDQALALKFFWANEKSPQAEIADMKTRLEELGALYRSYNKAPASRERTEALKDLQLEIRYLQETLSSMPAPRPAAPSEDIARMGLPGGDFVVGDPDARVLIPAGFWARQLSPQLARHFDVAGGMMVDEVLENSSAQKAGLKSGDVIVDAAGRPIFKLAQLQAVFAAHPVKIELRLVRDKQSVVVTIARD